MKRRFFILQVIFFITLITFLFFNCTVDKKKDDNGSITPAKMYAIGDMGPSGVGIVFYITEGGLHGLEAAPSDQSTSQVWSNITGTLITGTNTSIGTGLANSNAIIAQGGHSGSAAQVCRSYNGGGLTDWFLPSKDELNKLYLNKTSVGGFANGYYWSSSENSSDGAWYQYFGSGLQGASIKDDMDRVRAVRYF